MKTKYLLDRFELLRDGTAITREDFETYFLKTNEKVTIIFNGYKGKSYNGKTLTTYVYRSKLRGFEDIRFIKFGKALHNVEDNMVLKRATNEYHNRASWFIDVLRK